MSEYKYTEEIQSEYDTDGHKVFYDNGDEDSGIRLPAALAIAEQADEEITRLRAEIESLEKRLQIDTLNPNRRKHLNAVLADNDRLRAEVERLEGDGIHSCSPNCPRPMCVLRRENKRLRAEVEELRERDRWIPVAEKRPPVDELIEVYLPLRGGAYHALACIDPESGLVDPDCDPIGYTEEDISHWRATTPPEES